MAENITEAQSAGDVASSADADAPLAAEIHSHYPVSVEWLGEKRGRIGSSDGLPDVGIASPPQFGGHAGEWSPEHLFVASALACWMTTFIAIAGYSKLEIVAVGGEADGEVAMNDDKRYHVSAITLRPRVMIHREEDREKALRLIQKAESNCLISRSMRTPIALDPGVVVAAG